MRNSLCVVAVLLAALCSVAEPAAQPGAPAPAAAPADPLATQRAAFDAARAAQVDALAPRAFEAANDFFEAAQRDQARGRDAAQVQAQLQRGAAALAEATRAAEGVRAALPSAAKARADAIKADAPRLAPQAFSRADGRFVEAMGRAERGDVEGARGRANEAETLLRTAELEAIRARLLGNARALIAQADATKVAGYAPRTLADARRLADQAALEIERNRYDLAVPKELAAKAEYQARHAVLLAGMIKPLLEGRREDAALETMILEFEAPLEGLAGALEVAPRFDEGYLRPLDDMQRQAKALHAEVTQRRTEADAARREAATLRDEVKRLTARAEELERQATQAVASVPDAAGAPGAASSPDASTATAGDPLAALRARFAPDEAAVVRQGNDLVITLTGLRFPVGEATLDASSLPLLEKLDYALAAFRGAVLMVEGHTDASGNDEADVQLSQDRAFAVGKYLIDNAGVARERVTWMGYGATRPLLPNDTAEGRARNRRIEVTVRGALQP